MQAAVTGFGPLQRFLRNDPLEGWRSASFLRLVFLLTFYAQIVIAALIAVALRVAVGASGSPSGLLAAVLVACALAELPIALASTMGLQKITSRQQALSRALFMGVLLSSTAWFAAFALATGQGATASYALLAIVLFAYALGFLAVGRLARRAAELPPTVKPSGADSDALGGE
ncbi:MAG: hypothetical protein KF813_10715 [Trueperaceae bacterium]|nr:hypothetical protein [Trueperaceae bacterium]